MFVYIMTEATGGTLYIGVTNDLVRRVYEHREGVTDGFTKRYGLTRLVYFEQFEDPADAISREKKLKHWRRQWKVELIENSNPTWRDLWPDITGDDRISG